MDVRSRRQVGFTLIEVTVVIAVLALALQLFIRNYVRAQDFSEHEQARMRNVVDQQESIRALALLLQAVDIDSLTGFDEVGVATAPSFRRWLHDPALGVQRGTVERLVWEAHGEDVGDVSSPGRVVLVSGTERIVVAERVPADGFECRLDGRRMTIHLETYYPTASNAAVRTSTSTAVFLGRGDL